MRRSGECAQHEDGGVSDDGAGVAGVSVARHGDGGADQGRTCGATVDHGDGGAERCGREEPGSRA